MRAILLTALGGPEVLVPAEVPRPVPGAGRILVRAEAIPVLHPELALRSGVFPLTAEPPVVFGYQAVGTVAEVGADVPDTLLGTRVAVTTDGVGAYAEFVEAAAQTAVAVPDGLTSAAAAAAGMPGSVALPLLERAALTGSETVLVQAGATGIGAALVQLAKANGARRVLATAGGAAKAARAAELGADAVLDHSDPAWPEQLTAASVDVVFDSIGGPATARLLPALTPGTGRILSYGWLSGAPAELTAAQLIPAGLTVTACAGPAWSARVAAARPAALALAAAGTFDPGVGAVLPLEQAAEAHRGLERRTELGRPILVP